MLYMREKMLYLMGKNCVRNGKKIVVKKNLKLLYEGKNCCT